MNQLKMENKYLNRFKRVIRSGRKTTTYKMAWARSLVEICSLKNLGGGGAVFISLKDISDCFLRYFWNQTVFFNLKQLNNQNEQATACRIVSKLAKSYFDSVGSNKPVFYEIAYGYMEKEMKTSLDKARKSMRAMLKQDVAYRFDSLETKEDEPHLYVYDAGDELLRMPVECAMSLRKNEDSLYEIINLYWAYLLEEYNVSPRINHKVKILGERKIKRNSLAEFKHVLDISNPKHECFYCGKTISGTPDIDHVIPWSYLYADNIWNLVYACPECNRKKSNVIPDPQFIDSLKRRNGILLSLIGKDENEKKYANELATAEYQSLVDTFYLHCKQ